MGNRDEADEPDGDESSAALLRVPVLERQVAALERVVAIERRLRELSKARTSLPAALAPPCPQSDDVTVLTRQRWEFVGNDSTRLSRSPIDDSTVLHRLANPAYGAAEPIAQTPASSALVLASGFQLFEYRIDSVLGQGGFGITYLATDIHLNAKVAIKEYLPAGFAQRSGDKSVWPRWPDDAPIYQAGLDRFLVEARTLATFRHPNIVRVARFFEANRTAYMVLEYERGKALKQWWPGRKRMREAELLGLLQPLLDGLAVVHAAGFLHRDIKPDNIYVRKDDGSLVLLDFGAARQAVGHACALPDVVTPGYAPSEQYDNGAQGPWTDIYSLGATLYWIITGAKPPEAPARLSGAAQMTPAQQACKGQYSDAFLAAIDWALQTDPAARPQDLRAFSQKLFASHAGSLALRDALNDGEAAPRLANESLRVLINSPKLFARRSLQFLRALLHPASWPMMVKMATAMVLAALLPMLITAYYNVNGSVEAVSAGEMRNLTRMAESTAGRLSQLITDNENLAKFLATEEDLIDYLKQPDAARKKEADAKLDVLVKTNPNLHLISLVDTKGIALISSEAELVGRDFSSREYFRQAMRGRTYQTSIIRGVIHGERGMYYAHPVVDAGEAVIGVLVMRIEAATFDAILHAATRGTDRVPLMIDGDGLVIHYRDPAKINHSLDTLSDSTQQRIGADQRFRQPRIESLGMPVLARTLIKAKQPGSLSYMSTLSGEEDHAGYAPVPGQDWVVALTESRDVFEAPLQQLFSNVLQSVVMVGVLFMVFAVLFARSIVRPIARLTQAATALKDGEYDRATIAVTSNDEIGRLSRTFNVMIDVLRQREREKGRGKQRGDEDDNDAG